MTVTKTAAKNVGLPVGSATALLSFARMAGDWSGTPMVSDTFGRSTGGYVSKLVAAGMVTAFDDDGDAFVTFTDAGIDAALALGAPEWLNQYRSTPKVEAKPVKVCKKDASHGEHRVTKTGSYCYTCDRIAAEAQKAARKAAK